MTMASYETTQGSVTINDDETMNTSTTQFDVSQLNITTQEEEQGCAGTFSCSIEILKFQTCFDCRHVSTCGCCKERLYVIKRLEMEDCWLRVLDTSSTISLNDVCSGGSSTVEACNCSAVRYTVLTLRRFPT
jgi:hypothetical protein